MARVYETASRSMATLFFAEVALVEAHLLVWRVDDLDRAGPDWCWYFDARYDRDHLNIYRVPAVEAELLIHFVEREGDAGWRRPHFLEGRIGWPSW